MNNAIAGFSKLSKEEKINWIASTYFSDSNEAVSVLIGPEGDFTLAEIQTAISKGWKPISLGNNRLRTETAALHALSSIILKLKGR